MNFNQRDRIIYFKILTQSISMLPYWQQSGTTFFYYKKELLTIFRRLPNCKIRVRDSTGIQKTNRLKTCGCKVWRDNLA